MSLLVTATSVALQPQSGPPHRLLRISARGFFGGSTLYAHVVRRGKHGGPAARLRIGPVKGDCMKVHARKRLFRARHLTRPVPGPVRHLQALQGRARKVESEFIVTVFPKAGTARASSVGVSPAS